MNPNSKLCKLPEQVQESIRAMHAEKKDEKKDKRVHFGGNAVVNEKPSANSTQHKRNCTVLNSGASTSMIKSKTEVQEGSYVK